MELHKRIGDFLISIDAITEKQRDEVLKYQQNGDKRLFGEIAVSLGYVDKEAIKKYFNLNQTNLQ